MWEIGDRKLIHKQGTCLTTSFHEQDDATYDCNSYQFNSHEFTISDFILPQLGFSQQRGPVVFMPASSKLSFEIW